ncbi:hypothetical protein H2201_002107 [Coniosporium apollinis]|uniref:ATPase, vacuolar ER assembly factor, Vma12 n=2 Tax=Coniosporium TaxID=2810619 RepID=A0ABQ9NZY4_9PEZI|nr:hypothetical protein H2199_000937 [Cladosporium sp. JES 115]KAJ9667921.1 hypothetical protein H2201_002107 [Coniosporium apollinis]
MVLLTMTRAMVAAVKRCHDVAPGELEKLQLGSEPSLAVPEVGNPISHGQLIDISKLLKARNKLQEDEVEDQDMPYRLNDLLRGSKIHIPPPAPKPAQSSEYKALMARLRAEEEARAYERMLNPPPAPESFTQRFPASPHAHLFNTPSDIAKQEADEVTYADVNRQVALIINVLVSIIACSVAIWIAARHWSTPQRLGLSMTGSGIVAMAEVAIYVGYLGRVKESKQLEKAKVEVQEVVESWVIEADSTKDTRLPRLISEKDANVDSVKFRKGKHR